MNLLGSRKKWWLGLSLLLVVFGLFALLRWDLRIGLDFTGGTLLEVASKRDFNKEQVQHELEQIGVEHVAIQKVGERGLFIKSAHINEEKHRKVKDFLTKEQFSERRFENVGPTVGKDLTRKAILAVVVASIAIILYVAYSFRSVPRPASSWRLGITAVIALIHDVFITIGIFAILGHFFGFEIDALFITALLTVMGFSVHDTIVVFDRLREHLRHSPISTPAEFEAGANESLVQTLNRSLNTSLTVLIVLLAWALLGGSTIRPFIIALIIGIAIGTFSSIFTATPLLVLWQQWSMRKRAS